MGSASAAAEQRKGGELEAWASGVKQLLLIQPAKGAREVEELFCV